MFQYDLEHAFCWLLPTVGLGSGECSSREGAKREIGVFVVGEHAKADKHALVVQDEEWEEFQTVHSHRHAMPIVHACGGARLGEGENDFTLSCNAFTLLLE